MVVLSNARAGSVGMVSALNTDDATTLNRLLAIGISPGIELLLERRFPSYVVKIGRTRVALDREIARIIEVRLRPDKSQRLAKFLEMRAKKRSPG